MESFMDLAMLIEAAMLSFLLALWITWMGLRGLFRLMLGAKFDAAPIRIATRQATGVPGRNAA